MLTEIKTMALLLLRNYQYIGFYVYLMLIIFSQICIKYMQVLKPKQNKKRRVNWASIWLKMMEYDLKERTEIHLLLYAHR